MAVIDEQRRAAWLKQRLQGLGASDIPVLFGLSQWKSPYALWAEKVQLSSPVDEMSEQSEWGLRLEEPIALKFGEETGRYLRPRDPFAIIQHPEIRFLQATIDRDQTVVAGSVMPFDLDPANAEALEDGVVELKTAYFTKGSEWADEPPLAYQVQLQAQLLVTGRSWGSIAVLIGGSKFIWKDIQAHPEFQQRIVHEATAFWDRVLRQEAPDVDGSEATKEAIKRAFPKENDVEAVLLPDEAIGWDERRQEAKEAIAGWESVKLEAENKLRAAIGNHLVGVLPNGVSYSLKTQDKKAYTVAASSTRVLRRKADK